VATNVPVRARAALIVVLLGTLATALVLAQHRYDPNAPGYKISGRIVDPHRVWSDGAVLTLLGRADNSYSMRPVALTSKKSFVTPPVPAGTYVLEVTRKQEDTRHEPRVIGSTIVEVTSRDISGVTVELRRDTAITGVSAWNRTIHRQCGLHRSPSLRTWPWLERHCSSPPAPMVRLAAGSSCATHSGHAYSVAAMTWPPAHGGGHRV
jgi:hypothetical protein